MNKMEIAIESLTGKDPEKAYKDMSIACNTFGLDIKGFLDLIKQSPKRTKGWTNICWYWIASLSRRYGRNDYDLRNQQSCYIGSLLQQAVDEKFEPLPKLARDGFITVYIGQMAYDCHKTTQQSFSSLVFAWLDYLALEKGNKKAKYAVNQVRKNYNEHWYKMPMY